MATATYNKNKPASRLVRFLTKANGATPSGAAGQPCQQGQTAAVTGCIPASGTPAPPPSGGSATNYSSRLAKATAAYTDAIATLSSGKDLTPSQKKSVAAGLLVMTMPQLKALHQALKSTAAISGAGRAPWARAIKDILSGGTAAGAAAPAATPASATTSKLPVIPFKDNTTWETGKEAPGTLNGVDFAPAPPKFWEKVKDVDVGEPPPLSGKKVDRVGILVQEPDGRIWIAQPTNSFGNRKYTLPGGHAEPGLTDQQNALKEVWEETGIQAEITGYLGDFEDSNNGNNGRLYIGKRIGGAPWDAKIEPHIISNKTGKPAAESESVNLVTPEQAAKLLHRSDDLGQLIAVHPIKLDQPTTGAGSNPIKKFLAGIQPAKEAYMKKLKAKGQSTGNPDMHIVQELRGFNAKPKVVSKTDMDALVAKGDHIEMLRGLTSSSSGRVSSKRKANIMRNANIMAEEFKTGDHYPGFGCFGSGTYCDSNKGRSNAAISQYSNYGSGVVIRMAIPRTAKIVKFSELEKKCPNAPSDFQTYGSHSRDNCWRGMQAALAGYDAIHVDGNSVNHGSYGKGYYIILNRGIVTVQKEDATGHVIK